MERGSSKHSPRVDEEMGHEVEGMMRAERPTRAEEWKEAEPSGEDQPDSGVLGTPAGRQPAAPPGMTPAEVELRSELAAALTRAAFPNDESGLLSHLVDSDAPDRLRALVRQLPSGRVYQNVGEVAEALGLHREEHRF
ncbi:MAG TPA: DUF2795 domain-containing protein [Mycobacteriales bacterium]|jgi:hypothetical protein|nr:DUF2795 domain-containing protein [Mycobacteriales bacterium]